MKPLRKHRKWLPLIALNCALLVFGCSKSEDETDAEKSAEARVEKAPPVVFEGVFQHEHKVYDQRVVTELELTPEGIQQRRDGFVVFDAPCTQKNKEGRQVDFDCGQDDAHNTLWPLAFTPEGQLYHRAMPEMLYEPVETEIEDAHDAEHAEGDAPADAPEETL